MTRKLIALLLCLMMALGVAPALAEETVTLTVWNEPNETPELNMY